MTAAAKPESGSAAVSQADATDPALYGVLLEPDAVRFERLLPGPIERVWAWLTESDKRAQWLAAGDMPQRPGAAFELQFNNGQLSAPGEAVPERYRQYDRPIASAHELLRYEPPHVLAISWGGGDEALSEVLFELASEGDKVRLVLTHRRLADRKTMLDVSGGWHTHLAVLAAKLAGRQPPRFWALLEQAEAGYAVRLGGTAPQPAKP